VTGSGSGTISILPQAAAGTYNLNLPITAGTSGYFLTSAGGAGSPMTWTNPSSIITPAALTKTDDTNVTLTLGGSPTTALLQATSLTLGWTGQLGLTRGGTAASLTADFGGIVYSTASALAILASTSTARQILMSGASTTPAWSTATYPATTTVSQLLYSSSANVIAGLATANSAALVTTVGGVPIFSSSLSDGQVIIGVSGGTPVAASLSAGSGVTITPGAGTISIAATGSGGTVTSVSGTANQIDSTGGNTPVLSLSSTTIFPGTVTLHADPVSALQAVTKQYADAIAAGLEFKNACVCASTVALTVTYNNNASGIGATLTNATTQAAFSVDGQSPTLGQRVLIKNQASTFQNGIYTVTVVGTGATNWVLTRSLDFDQPSEIAPGDLVPVIAGTVNADTLWLQTQTVATIGTDAIVFSQFSSAPLTLPVSMANGGTNASLTANNGGIFYSTASAGAILSGTATARQMLQSGASTTPAWSTTTWPATTTANRILYSSSTSVIGEITSANSATLVTNSSGVPALTSSMTDGQILIGSTGGTPAPATLTAGSNVTITNASGSITIASTGGTGVGGSLTYITSQTASSSSSLDFVNYFSSQYDGYLFEFIGVLPATNTDQLYMLMGTGGTPTYASTGYLWQNWSSYVGTGNSAQGSSNDTQWKVCAPDAGGVSNSSTYNGIYGNLNLYGTNTSSSVASGTCLFACYSTSASGYANTSCTFNIGAATYTAARFKFSSGNIASGTIRMYGITNGTPVGTNGPIPWIDQTSTSATMVINTGYVADNGSLVTLTVPATVPFGSVLAIAGKGAGGWKIQMNTGQTADLGSSATTSAGSLASTNQYDAIELVCVTANTTFVARSAVGNITLA